MSVAVKDNDNKKTINTEQLVKYLTLIGGKEEVKFETRKQALAYVSVIVKECPQYVTGAVIDSTVFLRLKRSLNHK